jgi:hypothetical protein
MPKKEGINFRPIQGQGTDSFFGCFCSLLASLQYFFQHEAGTLLEKKSERQVPPTVRNVGYCRDEEESEQELRTTGGGFSHLCLYL